MSGLPSFADALTGPTGRLRWSCFRASLYHKGPLSPWDRASLGARESTCPGQPGRERGRLVPAGGPSRKHLWEMEGREGRAEVSCTARDLGKPGQGHCSKLEPWQLRPSPAAGPGSPMVGHCPLLQLLQPDSTTKEVLANPEAPSDSQGWLCTCGLSWRVNEELWAGTGWTQRDKPTTEMPRLAFKEDG